MKNNYIVYVDVISDSRNFLLVEGPRLATDGEQWLINSESGNTNIELGDLYLVVLDAEKPLLPQLERLNYDVSDRFGHLRALR